MSTHKISKKRTNCLMENDRNCARVFFTDREMCLTLTPKTKCAHEIQLLTDETKEFCTNFLMSHCL